MSEPKKQNPCPPPTLGSSQSLVCSLCVEGAATVFLGNFKIPLGLQSPEVVERVALPNIAGYMWEHCCHLHRMPVLLGRFRWDAQRSCGGIASLLRIPLTPPARGLLGPDDAMLHLRAEAAVRVPVPNDLLQVRGAGVVLRLPGGSAPGRGRPLRLLDLRQVVQRQPRHRLEVRPWSEPSFPMSHIFCIVGQGPVVAGGCSHLSLVCPTEQGSGRATQVMGK